MPAADRKTAAPDAALLWSDARASKPAVTLAAPRYELDEDLLVAIDEHLDRLAIATDRADDFEAPTPPWVIACNAPRHGEIASHAAVIATARQDRDPTAIVRPLPSHGAPNQRPTAAIISGAIAGLVIAALWLVPGRRPESLAPPAPTETAPAAPPADPKPTAHAVKPAPKPAASHHHPTVADGPVTKPRAVATKTAAPQRAAAPSAPASPAVSLSMPAAPESPRSPSATAKPGGHGGGSTAHAPKKIATVDTGASKPAPVATVAAKRPATTR